MPAYHQNDSHDWLGDCAESYVAYLLAHTDFEVFGAGKWTADLAVRDKESGRWFRVEVKSTDRNRRPTRRALGELAKKAELLASIRLVGQKFETLFTLLRNDYPRLKDPTPAALRKFVLG